MAQLILPVAGAAIGFAIGGPAGAQAGFAAGTALNGVLFPPKQAAPKPLDTKWSGVDYGTPIPWYIGTMRVAGIPIYLSEKEAVAVESEAGKGGSDVVTGYEYYADVMFLLADTESQALLDVFKEGRRIWTARSDASTTSLENAQNSDAWEEIRFYGGAVSQDPDPDYEADVGVGLAPAYIGRTTVFIKRCRLDSSANLPPFNFTIATSATETTIENPELEVVYSFDFSSQGSVQFGSTDFASPVRLLGETATASPSQVNVHSWTSPAVSASTTSISIAGIPPGGTTPFGGTSDSVTLVFRVGTSLYGYYGTSTYEYTTGGSDFSLINVASYVAEGSTIWIITDQNELYRYAKQADGNELASNLSANYCRTIVKLGSYIYGADTAVTGDLVQYDATTLAEVNRWNLAIGTLGLLCTDGEFIYDFTSSDQMVRFNGSTWDTLITDVGALGAYLGPSGNQSNPVLRDGYIYLNRSYGGTTWAALRARYLLTTYTPQDIDLADVVTELHDRAGDVAADIDVVDLQGVDVTGVIAGQVQPIKQILEQLALSYYFNMVESGGVMKYVRRNGSSIATIPYGDLGVSADNPLDDALLIDRGNDLERPSQVAFNYINRSGNKYEQGSEYSDRLTTESNGFETIQVGIVFNPNQAKARADSIVLDGAISKTRLEFSVGMEYAYLEPTDVVTVTARTGTTYRARIIETSEQQNAITCKAVLDDQFALSGSGITADEYENALEIQTPSDTTMMLLDVAPFIDSEATASGHLVAAVGSGFWPGASIRRSIDNADFNTQIAFVRETGIGGTTTTALRSNPKLHQVNLYDTLGVRVLGTLSSSTRAAMQLDRTINVMAVETTTGFWEVIRFRTATLTGTDGDYNLYTLSVLHRGRRGSESLVALHAIGTRCVLIRTNTGIREVATETPEIGLTRYYKGVTVGRSVASATTQTFANTCVRLKPWAPAYVRVARDGSNNATIYPFSRSRLLSRFGGAGGSVMPASDLDSFEIDVYSDGTFATIVRTLTGVASGITYSAANQTSDGLTPGDLLNIRAYQLNGTVNRGYALEAEA